ncbi:MAG: M43 family zinc metalloprotease [Bacteroidota bacterium]
MKKILYLLASALIFSAPVKAQMTCGTDDVCNKLRESHPDIKEWEIKLGAAIQDALEKEKSSALKYGKTTATVYDVPVVVHIVHDYGAEYITDDEIFDAVAYWDVVFNKQNSDTVDVLPNFKKYIGNPEIRLRLATKDPSGNATKGITRRQSYMTTRGSDEAKVDYWPNNKYINVWFVNKFEASHSGAAAYAYYPSTGAGIPHFDGIIGVYTYINYDKAIPHEFGHSLNLAHTWGNTNNPGVACGDDGVSDTPPTYGHTSCLAADLYDTRCATGYTDPFGVYHPNSTLAADTSNTQNIMDYSYCQKMFTQGQADRMRASLTSSIAGRNNLFSPANLAATGALAPRLDLKPIADFSVEKGVFSWGGPTSERAVFLCQNSTTNFQFRNRSWNDTITNVTWTFSNNPTSTSSSVMIGSVTNSFKDAGWATIKLDATGNNTGTSTIISDAVYVASTTAYKNGYANYFTSTGDFKDWPMFNHYKNNFKWEFNSSNGYPNGSGCICYRSFDDRPYPERYTQLQDGDFDDIYTPAFDITSVTSGSGAANLNFYTAGCLTPSSNYNDSLQIFASTNCGDSWTRITTMNFSDIINNSVQSTEFAPTNAGQWRAQTINIPTAMRTSRTFFRFRYWPTVGGNNLYFDNFTVSPWTTEIKNVAENKNEIKLFPNPTNSNTKLCFTSGTNGEATIMVRDVTGKVIMQEKFLYTPNTFIQQEIARSTFPASGVYLITLTQSETTATQKLVVE